MADDKIYFDEQALSIVDSWLSGKDNDSKSSKRVATSSTVAPPNKVGLGFKGKVSVEKTKDALQQRLEKSQKKKKNSEPEDEPIATKVVLGSKSDSKNNDDDNDNDDDDDDDDGVQLHGIVEDMPISRTQKSIKPVVLVKKQPKRKAELINGNLVCEKKGISPPVVSVPTESTSKASALSSSVIPGAENEYKRKRTKTRSKQKNIRRDNRPDSQKPSYITDIQSEDYRGRYLTEVKALLLFFLFPLNSPSYLLYQLF